jgi:hypothetical protein
VTLAGSQSIYAYAHATDGSLEIQPKCIHDPLTGAAGTCNFPLTAGPGAAVTVDVMPTNPQTISVPGVSGPVQVNWKYSYTFAGLTIGK